MEFPADGRYVFPEGLALLDVRTSTGGSPAGNDGRAQVCRAPGLPDSTTHAVPAFDSACGCWIVVT